MPEHPVFEVSQVNGYIKSLLDGSPVLADLCVRGELSNYKVYPSGHHYFTLKDRDGALRCVLFRSQAQSLRFRPETGMKVLAAGRVSVFPRDGAYQLYCTTLTREGVGDLYAAFEQLKQRLYAEGLFDARRKKPLPAYPGTIAIITSSAGAAVHDMLRILRRRYPIARAVVLPVRVQGAEAPAEIAGAIRYANRWRVADLIITGRGGGSMEDLWAFNDERVARAIYDSELPVISAVGHEPDVTIADYVADARAATPSNAAEIAVPDQVELLRALRNSGDRMVQAQTGRLDVLRRRLADLSGRRAIRDPAAYVQDRRMDLVHVQQRMADLAGADAARRREGFSALAAALDAMSPLKVLGRGYAMARSQADGAVLKSFRDVGPGDRIDVTLGEGGVLCTVDKPYPDAMYTQERSGES